MLTFLPPSAEPDPAPLRPDTDTTQDIDDMPEDGIVVLLPTVTEGESSSSPAMLMDMAVPEPPARVPFLTCHLYVTGRPSWPET